MAHIQDRRKQGRGWVARMIRPDGHERARSFDKRSDAEKWLTTQEAGKLRGDWVDPALGRLTFGEWVETWWNTTANLRDSSRARDESYLRNHVLPSFEDVPLNKITQEMVRGWAAALSAKGLAPATVRLVYACLSKPMSAAVDAQRIPLTPCRNIPLPNIEREEMRFLTPEQVSRLADAVGARYTPVFVYTAAYTGLRWGELAGLRPDHVDPLKREIRVEQQLTEVSGVLSFGPPKTRAGRRTVKLPLFLAQMLGERMGETTVRASNLVFPSTNSEPMRRGNFRRRQWLPSVADADLGDLSVHELRHTAVALAIAQGAHAKAIQVRMGHASVSVTLDRYGHLFPSLDEAIADGLDVTYSSVQRPSKAS